MRFREFIHDAEHDDPVELGMEKLKLNNPARYTRALQKGYTYDPEPPRMPNQGPDERAVAPFVVSFRSRYPKEWALVLAGLLGSGEDPNEFVEQLVREAGAREATRILRALASSEELVV